MAKEVFDLFEASEKNKYIIGAKQVKNAIRAGKATKVYVASDCDPEVSGPVIELAERYSLPLFYITTRKELGRMCGIDVKAACAAETL